MSVSEAVDFPRCFITILMDPLQTKWRERGWKKMNVNKNQWSVLSVRRSLSGNSDFFHLQWRVPVWSLCVFDVNTSIQTRCKVFKQPGPNLYGALYSIYYKYITRYHKWILFMFTLLCNITVIYVYSLISLTSFYMMDTLVCMFIKLYIVLLFWVHWVWSSVSNVSINCTPQGIWEFLYFFYSIVR